MPIKPRGMHQRNYDRLLGVLAYHEALRKQGASYRRKYRPDQYRAHLWRQCRNRFSSHWWVVSSRPSDRLTDKGMNQKRSSSCHREALLSEDGWEYRAKPSYTFFSPHVSGTQRLRTGNMLICEGQWGRLSETDCQVTINPPSERPTSLLGNRSFRMARNTVSGAALAPVVTIRPHLRTEILKRSEVASRGSRFCRDDRS